MAYGLGLPAFVLVRVVSCAFYARGDTATPVRATIAAVVFNVALKFLLVWGLHFGAVGIALGTSLGAWLNVGVLVWLALGRDFLSIQRKFLRALRPVIAAALVTGALALGGAELAARLLHPGLLRDEGMLIAAIVAGGFGYGAVTVMFRSALPLVRDFLRHLPRVSARLHKRLFQAGDLFLALLEALKGFLDFPMHP